MAFIKFYPDEPSIRCRNCRGKFQKLRCKWKRGPRGGLIKPVYCTDDCFREYIKRPMVVCEWGECGKEFPRFIRQGKPSKFCSPKCYHAHQKDLGAECPGAFKKGHAVTDNMRRKGVRNSPATEFKPGHTSPNRMPIGTESIWIHRNNVGQIDHQRVLVKVAERKWRLRCRLVWEEYNGPIPKGHIIVHINDDGMDDSPENLELITRAENLARMNAIPMNEKKRLFNTSVVMAKRWEVARNGEIATKMYRLPLYVRMMREGYVPE